MLLRWFLMSVLAVLAIAPARAENRLALVIGVNDYQNVTRLVKAVPDAQAMSAQLKTLGFDVTTLLNPTRRSIYAALSVVTGKLQPGDTILMHYSGHGVQIDGDNFLLPADIPPTGSGDKEFLKSEAIALSSLVDRFRATGVRVQILIIDACRDNPYAAGGTRTLGATRGLAPPAATPKGTFIMFSAGQGQSALDALDDSDKDANSPYTRLLLKKMLVPGTSLTDLARQLRDDVEAAANLVRHEQRPAYYDELSGAPFYFVPPAAAAPLATPAPPVRDLAAELAFWDYIKGANSAALFDVYLQKYGDAGQFSAIARIESERLKRAAAAPPAPAPPSRNPVTPPSAPARPGFDCAAAKTGVETAICTSAALADLDRELNETFRPLFAAASGPDLAALQEGQRAWRVKRDTCNSLQPGDALNACISRAYAARLEQLRLMGGRIPSAPPVAGGNSPSFDCRNAKTAVERQVCQDALLAGKDRDLAALFGTTLARLAGARRDAVIADQSLWLQQRDLCANVPATMTACIGNAYDRRMAGLRGAK